MGLPTSWPDKREAARVRLHLGEHTQRGSVHWEGGAAQRVKPRSRCRSDGRWQLLPLAPPFKRTCFRWPGRLSRRRCQGRLAMSLAAGARRRCGRAVLAGRGWDSGLRWPRCRAALLLGGRPQAPLVSSGPPSSSNCAPRPGRGRICPWRCRPSLPDSRHVALGRPRCVSRPRSFLPPPSPDHVDGPSLFRSCLSPCVHREAVARAFPARRAVPRPSRAASARGHSAGARWLTPKRALARGVQGAPLMEQKAAGPFCGRFCLVRLVQSSMVVLGLGRSRARCQRPPPSLCGSRRAALSTRARSLPHARATTTTPKRAKLGPSVGFRLAAPGTWPPAPPCC